MTHFDGWYARTLAEIRSDGAVERNERTGQDTSRVAGVNFRTDLGEDGFPLLTLREMPWSFVPEVMWMLGGGRKTAWLRRHTKIWDAFADDDGMVEAAYGWRWRHAFKVDQLEHSLAKLRTDPSTRHAVVSMWDPRSDLTVPKKNVPCPVMFAMSVIGGRLNLHLFVRSNDMVLGHPTDVAGFAFLTHVLAQHLGVAPGVLAVSIADAHVYSGHFQAADEMIDRAEIGEWRREPVRFECPPDAYLRAIRADDSLIGEVKDSVTGYLPYPPMKGLRIAL